MNDYETDFIVFKDSSGRKEEISPKDEQRLVLALQERLAPVINEAVSRTGNTRRIEDIDYFDAQNFELWESVHSVIQSLQSTDLRRNMRLVCGGFIPYDTLRGAPTSILIPHAWLELFDTGTRPLVIEPSSSAIQYFSFNESGRTPSLVFPLEAPSSTGAVTSRTEQYVRIAEFYFDNVATREQFDLGRIQGESSSYYAKLKSLAGKRGLKTR